MRTFPRPLALILLGTVLVYAQVVTFGFVGLDDKLLIINNAIAHGLSWHNIVAAFTTFDPELYIPLTLLSYQLEYSIAGLHPWLYHCVNLLLHLGSTACVYFFTRQLSHLVRYGAYATTIATVSAALFALHPLNTEAVTWVAARKDTLSAFFALLSLSTYVHYRINNNPVYYWGSIVAFALGTLAKVSIVPLPLVLLLIDAASFRSYDRRWLKDVLPFFAISLLMGTVAIFGKTPQFSALSLGETLTLGLHSISFFLQKLLWPHPLSVFYPHHGAITLTQSPFLLPSLVGILVVGTCIAAYIRHRVTTLSIGFFLLFLFPSWVNFWKNGDVYYASDRYAYVGSIGLFFLLATYIAPYLRTTLVRSVCMFVIAVLAVLSALQARTWKNENTVLSHALKHYPHALIALVNKGALYFAEEDTDAAKQMYTEAIRIDPDYSFAYLNMARLEMQSGNREAAMKWAKDAVDHIPNVHVSTVDIETLFFYGVLLDEAGKTQEALAQFQRATDVLPSSFDAHYNLGIMHQKYRNSAEALEAFRTAVDRNPRSLDAHYRLAATAAETGNFEAAIKHLEIVVAKDPQYQQAVRHLENLQRIHR